MTIAWAGVERLLDELIAYYQHHFTALEKRHPVSLSKKLEYLRVMQCDQRLPEKTREWLRITRIETKRLGNERHDLIHGVLHLVSSSKLKWRTQRVVYEGARAHLRHTIYSNEDLQRLSAEISTLGTNLSPKIWVIIGGNPNYFAAGDLERARIDLGIA